MSDADKLRAQIPTSTDPARLEREAKRAEGPNSWGLCEGCPPVGYPTDETRCAECPRRAGEEKDHG